MFGILLFSGKLWKKKRDYKKLYVLLVCWKIMQNTTGEECTVSFCNYRGQCIESELSPQCDCDGTFFGDHCQDSRTCNRFCRDDAICHLKSSGLAQCNCTEMYQGVTCFEARFYRATGSTGHCLYHIDDHPFNFHESGSSYCQAHSSALAMVKNKQQQTEIEDVITQYIGLSDEGWIYFGVALPILTEKFWRFADDTLLPFRSQTNDFPRWGTPLPSFVSEDVLVLFAYPNETSERIQLYFAAEPTSDVRKTVICEKYVNGTPCDSHPCLNGGTCKPIGCSYTCQCDRNFYSRHCNTPTFQRLTTSCEYFLHANQYGAYVNHATAKSTCENFNSSLAFIKNDEEQRFIEETAHSLFTPPIELWIGIELVSGNYRMPDGEAIATEPDTTGYPRWGRNRPTFLRKNKVLMTTTSDAGVFPNIPSTTYKTNIDPSLSGARATHPMYWTDTDAHVLAGYVCERTPARSEAFPCNSSPCQNGGNCIVTGCTFTCSCNGGYIGRRCEECSHSACESNPCSNRSTCLVVGRCTENTYTCLCEGNYTSQDCDCEIDPCPTAACQYGGTCIRTGCSMNYTCSCTPSFNGIYCENATFVLPTSDLNDCEYHLRGSSSPVDYNKAKAVCDSLNASLVQIKSKVIQSLVDILSNQHFKQNQVISGITLGGWWL